MNKVVMTGLVFGFIGGATQLGAYPPPPAHVCTPFSLVLCTLVGGGFGYV
jgi:hypothetical protein